MRRISKADRPCRWRPAATLRPRPDPLSPIQRTMIAIPEELRTISKGHEMDIGNVPLPPPGVLFGGRDVEVSMRQAVAMVEYVNVRGANTQTAWYST